MTQSNPANPPNKKQDLIHIAILLSVALVIGVYLIAATVVITKDGAWYIEQAKRLSSDPQSVIKRQPFGFPLLILITHKLVALFINSSSIFTWIYSAQGVTLLCRLLSLIPLYFIGKLLIGGKRSFQAILILIILPYPAQFTSEVLREWPNILFLASGLLFLFLAAEQSKWWMFGPAGFLAGLGYIIRPECAQIIIYGLLWILIRLFRPKLQMNRPKLLCSLLVLLIGCAIPAAAYTAAGAQLLPKKLNVIIKSVNAADSNEILEPETAGDDYIYPARYAKTLSHGLNTASVKPGKVAKAIGELAGAISENLMYYLMPALLLGIYCRIRTKASATETERLFMPAFAVLNIVILIVLFYKWSFLSRRHCMPLVVFTIFYVPIGLQISADFFANRFSKSKPASDKDCQRWFFILLIIGIIICLPKLLEPTGSDKAGFRAAAAWLKQNTAPDVLIATPDRRITFYAERKALIYETAPPGKADSSARADYIVTITRDENEAPDFASNAQKQYSAWENEKEKKKKIVIYKMYP